MERAADDIERAIVAEGFTPLGWLEVIDGDSVPETSAGTPARSLLLVGNAGPEMWCRFTAERASDTQTLDEWSSAVLSGLAETLSATAHFPFSKPPLPFQRWAARSGTVHTSPLGISIHADYGLWHAYRAAFAFTNLIDGSTMDPTASPCATCADRPCLATCPVSAFDGRSYDVPACAAHIATSDGRDCMDLGCRARRACPIGRDHIYEPAQAEFHMTAFLKARAQFS